MRQPIAAASYLGLSLTLAAGCGDAVDRRPATWGYISPAIVQPNCATVSCHSAAAAAAGLDLSDPDRGYKSLTGLSVLILDPSQKESERCTKAGATVACRSEYRPLVIPFNPDQSRVVHMLRARNAARMPPDRPLPAVDIALIERWILNGAQKVSTSDAGVSDFDAASELSADAFGDLPAADARDGDATLSDTASEG